MKASVPVPAVPAQTRRRVTPPAKNPPAGKWTAVPNATVDDLMENNKLSGEVQIKLLFFVLRHTLGGVFEGEKRPEWIRINQQERAKRYGVDRNSVCRALTDMEKRGILAAKSVKGCQKYYRATPESWEAAPPYERSQQAGEAVPEQNDTPQPEEAVAETSSAPISDRLIIPPGRKAKCVPARLSPVDREPVEFRIEYANAGTHPVEVSACSRADILLITFSANPTEYSEEKAKGLRPVRRNPPHEVIENTRKSIFESVTSAILISECEKPLDPDLFARVMAAAGPALPAPYFEQYCYQEIRAMRKKRKEVSPGILPALARQARLDFESSQSPAPTETVPQQGGAGPDPAWEAFLEKTRIEDPEGYEMIMRQSLP